MELKDFIRETLVQIIQGGQEANEELQKNGSKATVFPKYDNQGDHKTLLSGCAGAAVDTITFDVALTTEESGTEGGGLKVGIAGIGAGVKTSKESSSSTVSRVQFDIPIHYPQHQSEYQTQIQRSRC